MAKLQRAPLIFLDYLDGANAITGLNVVIGMTAAYAAARHALVASFVLIFVAAVLDHVDGYVARTYLSAHRAKRAFGKQFDTLADLLNFNVVPGVVLMALLQYSVPALVAAGTHALFGAVRLAHFNITADESGRNYVGLPTTYAGFFVMIAMCLRFAGYLGDAALLAVVALFALAQVVRVPVRIPGTFACIAILSAVFALTLIACRIVF